MTPLPPLAPGQLLVLLVDIAVLLLVGLCLGRLAGRIGLPPIVGELMAGVLLGPSLLGHLLPDAYHWLFPRDVEQTHLLDAVAQVGVLLLVGVAGAHMDLRLWRRRTATAIRVSLGGLLIPLGLGVGAGYLAPRSLIPAGQDRVVFALFLGVAMCVSSIPVIAKTLSDMKLIDGEVGQLTLLAGMVDDAIGWFLLSVVSAMAVGLRAGPLIRSVLLLVGFVVLAATVGRFAVRLALRLAARSPEPGPLLAVAVVIVLGGAVTTQAMGMEAVFGAFVAGLLVGAGRADPKRLAALRSVVLSVLAPIFLATAGLRMDLGTLSSPGVLLAAAALLAVAVIGKFAGAYAGARTSRLGHWDGLALGAAMNARGVVQIIVAMVGLRLGVLGVETYTMIALVAITTSLMAPPLLRLALSRVNRHAEERLRRADQELSAQQARPRA